MQRSLTDVTTVGLPVVGSYTAA